MKIQEETRLLNETAIHRVAAYLGFNLPPIGSVSCPMPDHPDRTPSFQIFNPGTRWRCYGCGRSGGSIDFVKEMLSLTFLEAKEWLADQEGISICKTINSREANRSWKRSRPPIMPVQHLDTARCESSADSDLYEAYLALSPLRESGAEYLSSRAIDKNLVKQFMIHQAPDTHELIKLVGAFGFDRVCKSGLLTSKSTPVNIRGMFSPRSLVFPFKERGRVVYLQSRIIEIEGKRNRWWNLRSRRKRIYNIDVLNSSSSKKVAICEGILDAISATYFGYDAIALMGVGADIPEKIAVEMRDRRVAILLDWDDAGEAKAKLLKERLAIYGVSATRLRRPASGAKDVNEHHVKIRAPK